jgi:hypothetical protein
MTITAEISTQTTIATCMAIQKPGIGWRSISRIIPSLRDAFACGARH